MDMHEMVQEVRLMRVQVAELVRLFGVQLLELVGLFVLQVVERPPVALLEGHLRKTRPS